MSPYNSIEPVHPAVIEARELLREEQTPRDRDMAVLARAVLLSPSIDICEALLRGEAVPLSKLDPLYFRRYGIRRSA